LSQTENLGHKCTLAVQKFILPNFGNFHNDIIWHQILKLKKIKVLGLQKVAFEGPWQGLVKGMLDWLGKVRLG